jgi:hypothetical protein
VHAYILDRLACATNGFSLNCYLKEENNKLAGTLRTGNVTKTEVTTEKRKGARAKRLRRFFLYGCDRCRRLLQKATSTYYGQTPLLMYCDFARRRKQFVRWSVLKLQSWQTTLCTVLGFPDPTLRTRSSDLLWNLKHQNSQYQFAVLRLLYYEELYRNPLHASIRTRALEPGMRFYGCINAREDCGCVNSAVKDEDRCF